jgi:FSR family fosmidomycin resistance protein-like MFS transporter
MNAPGHGVMSKSEEIPLPGPESSPARTSGRPDVRLLAMLSLSHFMVDINQGALPALLPSLKDQHLLSYAAVGALVLVANLTSSVIQPIFGFLADRNAVAWMLPLSVLLAGLGLSLAGAAPNYWALLGLLVVMGIGVASFHPVGYKAASNVAGERRATALSWFSVGGNAGTSFGPPVITALIAAYGMTGSLGMLLPALLMAVLLVWTLPSMAAVPARLGRGCSEGKSRQNMPGAILLLILVVAIRSWAQLGFLTFIPFYYVDYLKADPQSVGIPLFVFLGAGAIGTVIGGPLADRWGTRRFMLWGFLASAPMAAGFLLTGGAVALVFLGLFGGILISTFAVTVVLGQSYLPSNAGLAAGIIVGFAIGTGGVAVALLGWIADQFGLLTVLWISALMPAAGCAAVAFLPEPGGVKAGS